MNGSRRLPPRTRPTLDLASAQNTASVFYGPAHLGLCWGRFDLRALALMAGRSIPRRGKIGSRFCSVLDRLAAASPAHV